MFLTTPEPMVTFSLKNQPSPFLGVIWLLSRCFFWKTVDTRIWNICRSISYHKNIFRFSKAKDIFTLETQQVICASIKLSTKTEVVSIAETSLVVEMAPN